MVFVSCTISGWISEQNWDNITELDKVSGFHGIIDSFEQHYKAWNGIIVILNMFYIKTYIII